MVKKMFIRYLTYFLAGGIVVSSVTYFACHSRSFLAAFLANMPTVTLITFLTIYLESGSKAVMPYANALLITVFPWVAYVLAIILLTPRLGFIASLITGLFVYFIIAFFIIAAKKF